jgi:hypothetical protein
MDILTQFGINTEYVMLGMAVVIIVMFIIQIVQAAKISKQKKRLNKFLEGSDGKSLEGVIKEKLDTIDAMNNSITSLYERIDKVDEVLLTVYRKTAIVKYDAFKDMGGKLSFILALLNEQNNGFIINSMHSNREGCFTYVKEIIGGQSFITLSEEEKQALDEAVNSTNFME